MSTPLAIVLGVIVLAVLGFAVWYLQNQAAIAARNARGTGLTAIGNGLGQAVSGVFSLIG